MRRCAKETKNELLNRLGRYGGGKSISKAMGSIPEAQPLVAALEKVKTSKKTPSSAASFRHGNASTTNTKANKKTLDANFNGTTPPTVRKVVYDYLENKFDWETTVGVSYFNLKAIDDEVEAQHFDRHMDASRVCTMFVSISEGQSKVQYFNKDGNNVLELIYEPGVNVGVTHGINSGGRVENPKILQHSSCATHDRKLLRFVFVPHEQKIFKGLSMTMKDLIEICTYAVETLFVKSKKPAPTKKSQRPSKKI
jgi:hypothetical protein